MIHLRSNNGNQPGVSDTSTSTSTGDEYFFPLDLRVDLQRLRNETEELLARVPLAFEGTRQLALHSFAGSEDPWYDGCRKQRYIGNDRDYTVLHPELCGTYFEALFDGLPFRAYRARLMELSAKTCYSIHRDDAPRYHIAIHTNPHSRFVFAELQRVVHIPADGIPYFVDTRQSHTAFNGGKEARLHLVFGG